LINHLTDGGIGPVGEEALLRALAFAEYLKSHALRAYGAGAGLVRPQAKAILARIRRGDIKDGFTAKDVYRNHWAGLGHSETRAGLELLEDFDWLRPAEIITGGRPITKYTINPRALQ
jgi:hypothetical protein